MKLLSSVECTRFQRLFQWAPILLFVSYTKLMMEPIFLAKKKIEKIRNYENQSRFKGYERYVFIFVLHVLTVDVTSADRSYTHTRVHKHTHRIYNTIVTPVVKSGCEVWTMTLRNHERLLSFKGKKFKRMCGSKKDVKWRHGDTDLQKKSEQCS